MAFFFCLSLRTTLQGSAVLRSYGGLMGTMTLCHTTQAIENDKSFQLKNLYAPQVLFTGLPGGRSCQQQRQEGSLPIPFGRGLSPIEEYFLESSIMPILCDIHQQVFSKHWVILQQFYGFVWVCALLFKIIFIWQSGNFLLETRILHPKTC